MATRRRHKTPLLVEAVPARKAGKGSERGNRPSKRQTGGGSRSTTWRVIGWLVTLGAIGLVAGVGVIAAIFLYYGSDPAMPRIDHVGDYHPKVTTHVVDRNGELLGEIFEERRTLVPREKIPPAMVHAIVDAEDAQFFEHKGLNYWGMVRAILYNLRPGAHLQGASTITQQLVKTYLLKTNERTVKRKVQEAILARRLESALSKDEILYLYLNQIYFGHRRYGVEEAARFFFGKSVSEVNPGEAALLASLPKGPEEISPLRHPERAKDRQRYVLSQMLRYDHVTKAEAERYASAPIEVVKQSETIGLAPEFVDEARRQLVAKFGEDKLPYLGLTVETTCDSRVQKLARDALEKSLEGLDERQGYRKPLAHLKQVTPQSIKSTLTDRSLRHLHQLLNDSPSKAQRAKWLEDRDKALAAGKVTEAVVVEVRTAPDDYGVVVDTGAEKGFLRVPKPDDKRHDRYNPKELPLDKRYAVGDVITVRAEPSLGRHPATGESGTQGAAKPASKPAAQPPAAQPPDPAKPDPAKPAAKAGDLAKPAPRTSEPTNDDASKTKDGKKAKGHEGEAPQKLPTLPAAKDDKKPKTAGRSTPAPSPGRKGRAPLHTSADSTDDEDDDGDDAEPTGWPIVVPEFGPNGAVIVIDPSSRDVRAMVGGYGFHAGGFNRATMARRQPGSAFKPFLYAAAFDSGKYTPASVLNDSPQIYELPGLKAWKPKNAESHEFLGQVRLRVALAKSLNTVASQLIFDLQPGPVAKMAHDAGIESELEETLALGLGASVVSLVELTNAYATFATGGRRAPVRFLDKVGAETQPSPVPTQSIKPEIAFLVTSIMQSVIEEGTAASAKGKLHRPAAGKTGTTSSERDAWFVGFTPDLVVGVWVGFDDLRDLGHGEQGARSALPVWVETLTGALKGVPPSPFSQPAAIEVHKIDPASGKLAPPGAPTALDEYFLPGTAPTEVAPLAGEQNPDTFIMDQQQ